MITVKNGQACINKLVKLRPKQVYKMSLLEETERELYLMTIMGIQRGLRLWHHPWGSKFKVGGDDRLANKNKHSVLRLLQNRCNNDADYMHVPTVRRPNSFWVGVEIECLIEGEDESSCDTCDNEGTLTCCNCEGNGVLNIEDSNGHDYEVNCAECGGEGHVECPDCDDQSSRNSGSVHAKLRNKLKQANITLCSVKSDGSVEDDDDYNQVGVEVTVLFDASQGYDKLKKVCSILNSMGAKVNASCGLHVHLDMAKMPLGEAIQLGNRMGHFLPILSHLVPPSRRTSSYCRVGVSKLDGERYFAINLTSLKKHNTIEVRLHSGTTDAVKIQSWVQLLESIVKLKSWPTKAVKTFQELIDAVPLAPELVAYYDKRFQKFNPETHNHTAVLDDLQDNEVAGAETWRYGITSIDTETGNITVSGAPVITFDDGSTLDTGEVA